jgi:hypothetical protein
MSMPEIIANGGVIPNGSNEPKIEDKADVKTEPTLTAEELQLQKEQEKVQNIAKALEKTTQEYEALQEQLRQKRSEKKVVKQELSKDEPDDEEEDIANPLVPSSEDIKQLVNDQLEVFKKEPRQKAFSQFFNKYPEITQDEALRTKLIDRYEKIKESNEVDADLILKDLEASYYSLRGAEIIKQQIQYDGFSEQVSVGSRFTGSSAVGSTSSSTQIDRATLKAATEMSSLGITPERARELKKKGYL